MASPGVVANPDVLAVLRGFDPDVEEVLASSGHVSLYTMAVESQQWTRKDVEGSLFLLKRRGTPRFRMMVLNKLSTENYYEDIHGGLDFELNPPYLMYTHGNSEIIGVWFYEQEDLHRVENVLMRIKQTNQQMAKPTASARSQTGTRQTSGKADDDNFYDKPNAAAASSHAQQPPRQHAPQAAPQLPSAPAAGPREGSSNLATLLRNAQLKQQQQQAAEIIPLPTASSVQAVPPQPLPPSFFSQQHRSQPAPAPALQQQSFPLATAPVQAPTVAAAAPPTAPGLQIQARVPQVPMPPQAPPDHLQPQPQPPSGQMGGALAKLFANAHKPATSLSPAPQQVVSTPLPPPPAPPSAVPGAASPPAVRHPQQPVPVAGGATGSSGGAGLSDEERVRRLLARMATNDALVKLLAVELRAVGLLG